MPDLLLYDGVCGLCDRIVRFVLARDVKGRFVFASLQSSLAREQLSLHGRNARDLDTFYVLADFEGGEPRLYSKGRAALFVLRALGGIWGVTRVLGVLPTRLLDACYDFVASRRYRIFGRSEVCILPPPEQRSRFIDAQVVADSPEQNAGALPNESPGAPVP